MSIRVLVLCEGKTEEIFLKQVVAPYLWSKSIYLTATQVLTSPGHHGGVQGYQQIRRQLSNLAKEDTQRQVTTFFDLYRLPNDFPGWTPNKKSIDPRVRTEAIEKATATDIGLPNVQIYVNVHEYETLLFSDPKQFQVWVPETTVTALQEIKEMFQDPELINDDPMKSPSKRILGIFPKYDKPLHGPIIAERIGLLRIRQECRHFHSWLTWLESLA